MLRERFQENLKQALKMKNTEEISALRLIIATLKDKDIAVRTNGRDDAGISDEDIVKMLQGMVKQRRQSIELYEQGNRPELAEKEKKEIKIIEQFLPVSLSDDELQNAIQAALLESGAKEAKEMGKVIAILKEKYPGKIDFSEASKIIKNKLA